MENCVMPAYRSNVFIAALLLVLITSAAPAQLPAPDALLAPGTGRAAGGASPSRANCDVVRDADGALRFVTTRQRGPLEDEVPAWGSASAAAAGEWRTAIGQPGLAGASVAAILVRGDSVLVGGQFLRAGNVQTRGIALWDRSTKSWSAFPGEFNGEVRAIVSFEGDIIAGGDFNSVDGMMVFGIARWNGSRWDSVGGGFSRPVDELLVAEETLFAAGGFNYAGDNVAHGVARWTGSEWEQVGDGIEGRVKSLAFGGGALYAGGNFQLDDGASFNVARFDGTRWQPLAKGVSAPAETIAWHDGALYVGGDYYWADDQLLYGMARWNGSSWEAAGSEKNIGVYYDLQSDGENLYAAGSFTYLDGIRADGVARWTGGSWEPVGSIPGTVKSVAIAGGEVFAGGSFIAADGIALDNIAHYDGTAWEAMGEGLRDGPYGQSVEAIASIGDEVFVAGSFSRAGDVQALNIASWNRRTGMWSALGEGANARVNSLVVRDGRLIAGGEFTRAGDRSANHVAEWDPASQSWSRFGAGTRPVLLSVDVVGGELYASTYGLARWTGTMWEWDADGPDSWVYATEEFAGSLVATGIFEECGGESTPAIAIRDASGWHSLGGGLFGYGLELIEYDGDLVVGGGFETLDDPTIQNIARWNGSSWAAIDDGIDGDVWTLAKMGNDLYAGGFFGSAGVAFASNVARLSNGEWTAIGDGTDWIVYALSTLDRDLYVGGYFTGAGGDSANNIAVWSAGPAGIAMGRKTDATNLRAEPNPVREALAVRVSLPRGGAYSIELVDALGRRVRRVAGSAESAGEQHLSVECGDLPAGQYLLRCRSDHGSSSRPVVIVH
jgi:trimeric autotransporter adhesin